MHLTLSVRAADVLDQMAASDVVSYYHGDDLLDHLDPAAVVERALELLDGSDARLFRSQLRRWDNPERALQVWYWDAHPDRVAAARLALADGCPQDTEEMLSQALQALNLTQLDLLGSRLAATLSPGQVAALLDGVRAGC